MNGSLYLFPADAFATPPETSVLLGVLQKNRLLGRTLGSRRYLVGDDFFRHISFAGCSPSMQLEPLPDGSLNFTHISLAGPFPKPRLVVNRQHSRPRCPHCGKRVEDWKSRLDNWLHDPAAKYLCSNCNHSSTAAVLDWRRHAACARLLVEIHQVFPGEAVPADGLMTELKKATGVEWLYAWAESSMPGDPV